MNQLQLLDAIETFLRDSGMSQTAFGLGAVGDHKFLPRLRARKNQTVRTLERAEAYLARERRRLSRDNAA